MASLTPVDLALAGLVAVRRFGLGRTLLLTAVVTPVYIWSLPPTSCGCFRAPFRRCDSSLMHVTALKSELKYLASQQEIYFADYGIYSSDPQALAFTPSNAVSLEFDADGDSWRASATHRLLGESRRCSMYGGVGWSDDPLLVDAEPYEAICSS